MKDAIKQTFEHQVETINRMSGWNLCCVLLLAAVVTAYLAPAMYIAFAHR